MSSQKQDVKDEDDDKGNPYQNLDKAIVLQETREFNQNVVDARKCSRILTKILYLLNQGEILTSTEPTELFFAITKLFQSKDLTLRRLIYLCIKDLSKIAQDVIIVTSSLMKDMNSKEDLYRAAAIRALCSVTDQSMMQSIERYMKQAIVDKNSAISSSALVSALHLSSSAPEMVCRLSQVAQEVINQSSIVSYHALGVTLQTRKNDKISTAKLLSRLIKYPIKSPYSLCLLIRVAAPFCNNPEISQPYIKFIEGCLHHESDMVTYEAVRALVNIHNTAKALAPVVSVLQLFCSSSKPTLRLAGVKTLAMLTTKHATVVGACSIELENLISDTNRSIATLAVTTLLGTSTESSIDRLLKQISGLVSEIPDEFKTIVVKAIRQLCSKYPKKYQCLTAFLVRMLKEAGGLNHKSAIADAIISLIEENLEAKESGLSHLCEFIEDCEHATLAVRILHLLGREGPKSRRPARYLRFIYNRLILESGPVRAAAVSAVAQFGAQVPTLLPNVKVLLARCQLDEEDEVRDRAVYYSAILETGNAKLINDFIVNVPKPDLVLLEKALREHLANNPEDPFNMNVLSDEFFEEIKPVAREHNYEAKCDLGMFLRTVEPISLTEDETEYQVRLIKHIYHYCVVLEYECTNTLKDQFLEDVHVNVKCPPGFEIVSVTSLKKLYKEKGSVIVIVRFPLNVLESVGTFSSTLEFIVRDCDPYTGEPDSVRGYPDSYLLEDFKLNCCDQLKLEPCDDDWKKNWDCISVYKETTETFDVAKNNLHDAAKVVCICLGLNVESISEDAKYIRTEGRFRGEIPVMIIACFDLDKDGVHFEMTIRAPYDDVRKLIFNKLMNK